jgi:hypothetical protein
MIEKMDELNEVCDFIEVNINVATRLLGRSDMLDFRNEKQLLKKHYFTMNSKCKKDITKRLLMIKKIILEYNSDGNEKNAIKIVLQFENLLAILSNCIVNKVFIRSSMLKITDKERIEPVIAQIMKDLHIIIEDELGQKIPSTKSNFLKFFFNNAQYNLDDLKGGILFNTLKNYDNAFRDIFGQESIREEIRAYVFTLLDIWRTISRDDYKNNTDPELAAYCAMVIVKRVLLAMYLIYDDTDQFFLRYIDKLRPTLPELEDLVKTAFRKKQKKRQTATTDLVAKLRAKLEKKHGQHTKLPDHLQATQQQIKNWQRRMDLFLKQLEQEKQLEYQSEQETEIQLQSEKKINMNEKAKKKSYVSQQKHKSETSPFQFRYVSPGFHHRQHKLGPFRSLKQQEKIHKDLQIQMLRQRKNMNIPDVQASISTINLPLLIMDIAIAGKYSSIFLVDVANKRNRFASQQQMRSRVRQLLPIDAPLVARRKPLFVLIEQTDLDASKVPKATFDDHFLPSGFLQVKVSCVKQTRDGRRIDCYKKEHNQQSTKNPMDDFVLLTLRHTLRSYYYKYMRHIGRDANLLQKLQKFDDLIASNPFQALTQQQDEFGGIVRQAYNKVQFDTKVPYTWVVSDDQWRDWTRYK